jgi:hypothetical protein
MDYGNAPVKMTGHKLARNGYSKSQRAAFAAYVVRGELDFTRPTLKQLAKLFNVSVPYIQKALTASDYDLAMVRLGIKEIADIPPSTAELKRTISRAGIEPTWQALCDQIKG